MELFESIDESLQSWIAEQHMFFVSTAPLSEKGHVNCSPKGLDTFRILSPNKVAYLDLTGSGVETISHLRENGRITFMFCSFGKKPRILRLYGRGSVIESGHALFAEMSAGFPDLPGKRAIIAADITRIADSCGYAVPVYSYVSDRDTLTKSALKYGEEKLAKGRAEKNAASIDGLPGLQSAIDFPTP